MSLRALALDWSLDGPVAVTFLVLTAATGLLYLLAAKIGTRRDRRGRPWPRGRTVLFLAGLAVLIVDLYSGVGTEADTRLSVHMVEHMVMWVVVAPLLAAGAPVRLAFFALSRPKRHALTRGLHSRAVVWLTGPVCAVSLFTGILLVSHLPTVYGLALRNDYFHEAEHGLYLLTALLVWAPLLGADPLPRRPGPRGRLACMGACLVPMALIALWLGVAPDPVYGRYLHTPAPAALTDQRAAATIMLAGCLPALVVPVLGRARALQRRGRLVAASQPRLGIVGEQVDRLG
ncbi:MAG: cytochrome c oxidase assembly protein [Solirubrobacterales bacterium]|nr:cytochrome c oxidase assembly protein [Solirubrobacterales bacterium]